MSHDASLGSEPPSAQLHLHRGLGALYGIVGLVVLGLVVAGVISYVSSGKFLLALVATVVGLAITTFLAILCLNLVVPLVNVSAVGMAGQLTWGRRFNIGWPDITIDVDEGAPNGHLRLDLGAESVTVTPAAWTGFADFVLLVASTSAAAARLTPSARTEIARLLQIEDYRPPDSDGPT